MTKPGHNIDPTPREKLVWYCVWVGVCHGDEI